MTKKEFVKVMDSIVEQGLSYTSLHPSRSGLTSPFTCNIMSDAFDDYTVAQHYKWLFTPFDEQVENYAHIPVCFGYDTWGFDGDLKEYELLSEHARIFALTMFELYVLDTKDYKKWRNNL